MSGCDSKLVSRDDLYKAQRQTTFISDVGTGPEYTEVTNPDTGVTVPTINEIVRDIQDRGDAVIAASGYEVPVPYVAGLSIERITQTVLYQNDVYHAINVPFVTSGTFESDKFALLRGATLSDTHGLNLLSNHNFLTQRAGHTQPPPSSTPTSYPPGYEIFQGVFANETTGITNLTYIDDRVSFSGGDLYFSVPNSGGLEKITEFAASVADFDGKPRQMDNSSWSLVGDNYRVTVGVDDLSGGPLGSVKFEQGGVATGHEVVELLTAQTVGGLTNYQTASVADMKEGKTIVGQQVITAAMVNSGDVSLLTQGYYDGWAAMLRPKGAAAYILTTRQRVRGGLSDSLWEPDGFSDHYLFGGEDYVAMLNDDKPTVNHFGASKSLSDNQPNIQAMVTKLGYFTLEDETYDIQEGITFNGSSLNYGSKWSGVGKEKSALNCVNMVGKRAISYVTGSLCRVTFEDFKIDGDCDTCLNFPDSTLVYQSHFNRLWLNSQGSVCVNIKRPFSTQFNSVELGSRDNHAFQSNGGNTFVLINCYAHKCGDGFAGFRINGKGTLIGCNGIDETTGDRFWGWFGSESAGQSYNVVLTSCNAEDFGPTAAIKTEHFGSLELNGNTSFLPRASGTFDSIINMATSGNNKIKIGLNVTVASKGATLSGLSYIKAGDLKSGLSESPNFVDFALGSVLYDLPNLSMIYPAFQKTALSTQGLYAQTDYSFMKPKIKTIVDGDTTTTTEFNSTLQTSNSAPTTLQTITDVQDGVRITILIKDDNTTLAHNTGGTGRFILKSGASTAYSNADVVNLIANSGRWWEQ